MSSASGSAAYGEGFTPTGTIASAKDRRRVVFATVVGTTNSVTWYLAAMTVIGLIATLLLRDRSGIPLGPDHEAEQLVSPIRGLARA